MAKYILLLALASVYFNCQAQSRLNIKIDQQVPDFTLNGLNFSGDRNVSIRTLKKQAVILDFFSSTCTVCFKSLPKINQLQKDFKDQLKFILIGREDEKIKNVYEKFQKKYNLDLAVVYDRFLHQRLSIEYVPYYIWIDDENIVRAITGPDEVSKENITAFLQHKSLPMIHGAAKNSFDYNQYFLINGNGDDDTDFLFRSVLSCWKPNMETSFPPYIDYSSNQRGFQVLGASLTSLYNYAYFGAGDWNSKDSLYGKVYNKPILRTRKSDLFSPDPKTGNHLFCYSQSLPPDKLNKVNLQKIMQTDLKNYFDLEATVTVEKMPCWILTSSVEAREKLKTKGITKKGQFSFGGFSYTNIPIAKIIQILQIRFQDFPPFIDQTWIGFNIDISVNAILTDFQEFKKGLEANGLYLQKGEKEMKVITIKDCNEKVGRSR